MNYNSGRLKIRKSDRTDFKLGIGSGSEDSGAEVVANMFGYWIRLRIPNWICPVSSKRIEFHNPVTERDTEYHIEVTREYAVIIQESSIMLKYGRQTHEEGSRCKIFNMGWRDHKFLGTGYYDTDNQTELFWVADYRPGKEPEKAELEHQIVTKMPNVTFVLEESNGARVRARCIILERSWSHGTGWFAWLRFIRRPLRIREISVSMDRGLNSIHGGLLGIDVKVEPGVLIETALEEFFQNHNLKVVQMCYNP